MNSLLPINWLPRRVPLEPVAAAARGEAARRLARRLLEHTEAELAELRGAAGKDIILIFGGSARLPWVDGVLYLGQDTQAPGLYLPTALQPDVPVALVEQALKARRSGPDSPLAVLAPWQILVPVVNLRPLQAERIRHWLEAQT